MSAIANVALIGPRARNHRRLGALLGGGARKHVRFERIGK
jgi:hypothetical protein